MAQTSKMQIALKWGGIMAGGLILVSLLFYLMGMSEPSGASSLINTLLSYVISIGALVMGISAYKQGNANNLSVGDGVVLGILIALVGGILVGIYTYIFVSFIDPSTIDAIKDQTLASANTEGMDADQAEMVEGMLGAVTSPAFMALMVVVMKFFLGLIVGLIAGLIMKNSKEEYPDLT